MLISTELLLTPEKPSVENGFTDTLHNLHKFVQNHPFWENRLFAACIAGELSRDDFAYII